MAQRPGPWVIRIDGTRPVLQALSTNLTSGDIEVEDRDGVFHLRSPRLEGLIDAEQVNDLAQEMCRELEAVVIAATGLNTDIRVIGFGHERADGSAPNQYVVVSTITAGAYLIPPTARSGGVPTETAEDRAFRLHRANPDLAMAFRFLRGEPDWYRLYKAFELARAAAGGKKKMEALGWASAGKQSRFTHTADSRTAAGEHARHAVETTQPPLNPMTLGQAQEFVAQVVRRWSDGLP